MSDNFSKQFRKELQEAEREMARNKRAIDSSGPAGTPSMQRTTWSRKRKKHKGVSS